VEDEEGDGKKKGGKGEKNEKNEKKGVMPHFRDTKRSHILPSC
jgi:hypothetical protein